MADHGHGARAAEPRRRVPPAEGRVRREAEADANARFPRRGGEIPRTGNACPWCHRVTLTIALLGLRDHVRVVQMTDDAERASRGGWVFESAAPDPGVRCATSGARCTTALSGGATAGRCTAPLLVDRKSTRGEQRERGHRAHAERRRRRSSPCLRRFRTTNRTRAFRGRASLSFAWNRWSKAIGRHFNDFRTQVEQRARTAGCFATTQAAHNRAALDVIDALDALDARLSRSRFLCGDRVTESDVRLFPTIVRPTPRTPRCSSARRGGWATCPTSRRGMRDFYLLPGVRETVTDGHRTSYLQLFPRTRGGSCRSARPRGIWDWASIPGAGRSSWTTCSISNRGDEIRSGLKV